MLQKVFKHQTNRVATPIQHWRMERKHRCILGISRALLMILKKKKRALLMKSRLHPKIWGYAISQAFYIMNRVSPSLVQVQFAYHSLHNKLHDRSTLKVFGSL
jgi:hypothetical protein